MKVILVVLAFMTSFVLGRPQTDEFFDPNPQYKFSYKVASEETQTYMSQDESRDGDRVNGEYSYVDANGDLVTVIYTAGPEGYSETRSLQKGFVTIEQPTQAPSNSVIDENAIINQIVGGLAPFIEQSVALGLDSN